MCACAFFRRAVDCRTGGRRGPRRPPPLAIKEARRATRRVVCAAVPPCKCPSLRPGPGPAARPDRNTLSFSPSGRRCPLKSRWRRTRGYRIKCEWQAGLPPAVPNRTGACRKRGAAFLPRSQHPSECTGWAGATGRTLDKVNTLLHQSLLRDLKPFSHMNQLLAEVREDFLSLDSWQVRIYHCQLQVFCFVVYMIQQLGTLVMDPKSHTTWFLVKSA